MLIAPTHSHPSAKFGVYSSQGSQYPLGVLGDGSELKKTRRIQGDPTSTKLAGAMIGSYSQGNAENLFH